MLPLAPWFLTTRTVSQPSEDPSRIRPAATSDLVTWSATRTATVIPAIAQRTPRDLATAERDAATAGSWLIAIPGLYVFRPVAAGPGDAAKLGA